MFFLRRKVYSLHTLKHAGNRGKIVVITQLVFLGEFYVQLHAVEVLFLNSVLLDQLHVVVSDVHVHSE